jgi:hypothetical protein
VYIPPVPCKQVFRRAAILAAALAAFGAGAVLAPSAGATPPCPVKYCTDSNGEYVLSVPPLSEIEAFSSYVVCTWKEVNVDFGDGTSEVYEFVGSEGLTGSHRFPEAGKTYTVVIELNEAESSDPKVNCPEEFAIVAQVRYRTAEEEEDPPPGAEGGEPEGGGEEPGGGAEQPEGGGTTPGPPAVAPQTSVPGGSSLALPLGRAERESASYWRRCRRGVLAHRVGCRTAGRVARRAARKLRKRARARVAGFVCRGGKHRARPIVCEKKKRRILAPPA